MTPERVQLTVGLVGLTMLGSGCAMLWGSGAGLAVVGGVLVSMIIYARVVS